MGPGLCTERQDCGTNPKTTEMTGTDVEVICGEWDIATDTEEEYNVILAIANITRHPGFNITRGEANSQFVSDDIGKAFKDYITLLIKFFKKEIKKCKIICLKSSHSGDPHP